MNNMSGKIKDRVGEINYNNQGLKMWIKIYKNARDVDVEFEDGYIAYNKMYGDFEKGLINNKNYKKPRSKENISIKIDRIGETKYNKYGNKMTIIDYRGTNDITVEFENGYIINSYYKAFLLGRIYNPFNKTIYNYGYIGLGNENSKTNISAYRYWESMLQRCYSERFKKKQPQYKNITCSEEWHNFQNFARWFNENYYEIEGERMHLDKDILVKGNKIYSSDNCVFVPQRINELFTKRQNYRGEYPIGVSMNESNNKLIVKCNNDSGKPVHLGYFNSEIEAFNVYKNFKEKTIKKVANRYKNKIPDKLYNALYNYKVKITD